MKVVLTRRLPGDAPKRLEEHFDSVTLHERGRPLMPTELADAARGADVLICTPADRVDEKVLSQAVGLRCVITFSVGTDHLALSTLRERGIVTAHTPGVLTPATADLAWALILGCARRLKPAMSLVTGGSWRGTDPGALLGVELTGK